MKLSTIVTPRSLMIKGSLLEKDYWIRIKIDKDFKAMKEKIDFELSLLKIKYIEVNTPYRIRDNNLYINIRSNKKPILIDINNKPYTSDPINKRVQVAFKLEEYSSKELGNGLSPRILAVMVHEEQEEITLE